MNSKPVSVLQRWLEDDISEDAITVEPRMKQNKLFHSGGEGSGFEGHSGRPGMVGGSAAARYSYQGEYIDVNRALRGGEGITPFAKELDREIEENGTAPGKKLYRSFFQKGIQELNVGDTFTDRGFGSFSESQKKASSFSYGNYMMELLPRRKDNLLRVFDIVNRSEIPGGYGGEKEWIAPRGTTYRIIEKRNLIEDTYFHFVVEMVK
jgi:hypothetical protein